MVALKLETAPLHPRVLSLPLLQSVPVRKILFVIHFFIKESKRDKKIPLYPRCRVRIIFLSCII